MDSIGALFADLISITITVLIVWGCLWLCCPAMRPTLKMCCCCCSRKPPHFQPSMSMFGSRPLPRQVKVMATTGKDDAQETVKPPTFFGDETREETAAAAFAVGARTAV